MDVWLMMCWQIICSDVNGAYRGGQDNYITYQVTFLSKSRSLAKTYPEWKIILVFSWKTVHKAGSPCSCDHTIGMSSIFYIGIIQCKYFYLFIYLLIHFCLSRYIFTEFKSILNNIDNINENKLKNVWILLHWIHAVLYLKDSLNYSWLITVPDWDQTTKFSYTARDLMNERPE